MNLDWDSCRIAVFDVDGTLYESRPIQRLMTQRIGWSVVTRGDLRLPFVISALRRRREALADLETADFEGELFKSVAARFGLPVAAVRELHDRWFDDVPLPLLPRHSVPGVAELFAGLRRAGVLIGVLSDHRAPRKLEALGLQADIVVSAVDVGVQKPHPHGLQTILAQADVAPHQAVVIGDRDDRDGAVARRVGTRLLLRGRVSGAHFSRFDDTVFRPVLTK